MDFFILLAFVLPIYEVGCLPSGKNSTEVKQNATSTVPTPTVVTTIRSEVANNTAILTTTSAPNVTQSTKISKNVTTSLPSSPLPSGYNATASANVTATPKITTTPSPNNSSTPKITTTPSPNNSSTPKITTTPRPNNSTSKTTTPRPNNSTSKTTTPRPNNSTSKTTTPRPNNSTSKTTTPRPNNSSTPKITTPRPDNSAATAINASSTIQSTTTETPLLNTTQQQATNSMTGIPHHNYNTTTPPSVTTEALNSTAKAVVTKPKYHISVGVGVLLGILTAVAIIVMALAAHKCKNHFIDAIKFQRLMEVPMDDLDGFQTGDRHIYSENIVPLRTRT